MDVVQVSSLKMARWYTSTKQELTEGCLHKKYKSILLNYISLINYIKLNI